MLDAGKPLPITSRTTPSITPAPPKRPPACPAAVFGPTTAGRMDSYVDLFQSHGGSMIMIAKGNRGQQVTDACKKHGGFYLGSIGGPAAILAKGKHQEGRSRRVPRTRHGSHLEDRGRGLPRVHLVDDKGNDFFFSTRG
jgi:fumarate hydratase class I